MDCDGRDSFSSNFRSHVFAVVRQIFKEGLGDHSQPSLLAHDRFVTNCKFNIQGDLHITVFFSFFLFLIIYLWDSLHDHAGVQRSVCLSNLQICTVSERHINFLFVSWGVWTVSWLCRIKEGFFSVHLIEFIQLPFSPEAHSFFPWACPLPKKSHFYRLLTKPFIQTIYPNQKTFCLKIKDYWETVWY